MVEWKEFCKGKCKKGRYMREAEAMARRGRGRRLDHKSLAHAASEPSGAAPQDETRPREPLRAASLTAAGISEPLSAASKPGKKRATVHALFTQKLHRV